MTKTKAPSMFITALRGDRDDAMNGFIPDIASDGPKLGSSDAGDPQRWLAIALGEEETDLLLRITAMVREDKEVSEESRVLAGRLNTLVQASITNFVTYEQRKAEDLPTSTPIAS
jgi:hypothetical protein